MQIDDFDIITKCFIAYIFLSKIFTLYVLINISTNILAVNAGNAIVALQEETNL